MSPTLPTTILLLLYGAIVLAAAMQDVLTRRISNLFSIALVVVAGTALAVNAGPLWWEHLLAFAITLCLGILLFALGWMGGGDAKLMAAAALAFPMAGLLRFLPIVFVIGGVVALLSVLFRLLVPAPAPRVPLGRRRGVPYGVAIAAGAVATALLFRPMSVFAEPEMRLERLGPEWFEAVEGRRGA